MGGGGWGRGTGTGIGGEHSHVAGGSGHVARDPHGGGTNKQDDGQTKVQHYEPTIMNNQVQIRQLIMVKHCNCPDNELFWYISQACYINQTFTSNLFLCFELFNLPEQLSLYCTCHQLPSDN